MLLLHFVGQLLFGAASVVSLLTPAGLLLARFVSFVCGDCVDYFGEMCVKGNGAYLSCHFPFAVSGCSTDLCVCCLLAWATFPVSYDFKLPLRGHKSCIQ